MKLFNIGLVALLLIFSGCAKEEEDDGINGGGATENPSNLSSALFTAVLCTDLDNDAACENSLDVLPSVRIKMFTSAVNRTEQMPVFAEGNTDENGELRVGGLEAGQWFWLAQRADDLEAEVKQGEFNINRNIIPQLRLEWEE